MRPHRLLVVLAAVAAFAVVGPIGIEIVSYAGLSGTSAFMAAVAVPGVALMFVAGWVEPRLAWPVTGLVLVVMVIGGIAPWLSEMVSAGAAGLDPMSASVLRLAVPVVMLALVATAARRARG